MTNALALIWRKTTPEYVKEVYQDLKSNAMDMLKTKSREYLKAYEYWLRRVENEMANDIPPS